MRYYQAASLDYSGIALRLLITHLVNFRKVHKNRLQNEARLHGAQLK